MMRIQAHRAWVWGILLAALLVAGCGAMSRPEQPLRSAALPLPPGEQLGQTFTANFAGLTGVEVYLVPNSPLNGELDLILTPASHLDDWLSFATLPLAQVTAAGYYRFDFLPRHDSTNNSYFFALSHTGDGNLTVGTAEGDVYLDGSLYRSDGPVDGQLTFLLVYDRPILLAGLGREVLRWLGFLAAAAFLFVLPGWALLSVLWHDWQEKTWTEKAILSAGLGLALYPVLFMLSAAVSLHIGPGIAWGLPVISLGVILWRFLSHPRRTSPSIFSSWFDLVFTAVVLILFAARFWIIRLVQIPLWGDALQHSVITQLILDHNGLFTSWLPYAPYNSLTTHFGFSVFAALFAWITGVDNAQATLWVGQILNGIAVLTLYPLAVKISKGNRWAGIGTILAGGLVFALPAFYVNWGRFAQLAGQAILPVALWLLWDALDWEKNQPAPPKKGGARLLLAGLALTGMMLSYYRMPFYYATFVIVLLIFWGLPKWRLDRARWIAAFSRLLLIGGLGVILFLPWGLRLIGGNLVGALEAGVTTGGSTGQISAEIQNLLAAGNYFPAWVAWVAMIAVLWGLARKNWLVAGLPLWFGLLVGYMAGRLIRLPGANMLDGFAILIALYIPAALLIGWLFGEVLSRIERIPQRWMMPGVSLLILLSASWLGWGQRLLLDLPQYQLVTPPDLKAMTWIRYHTHRDASFLVQSFQYLWTGAGSDAGWWIPLLGQRANMLPPQYAQFNETPINPNYQQQLVDLIATIRENTIRDQKSIAALCEWGITHVYHGQRQGSVGGQPLYHPDEMLAMPEVFKRVYHQDRVSIFALNPEVCR